MSNRNDKQHSAVSSVLKNVYIARQPIFDRRKKVVAYELLFRSGFDNFYNSVTDGDYASSQTIMHSFGTFGLDVLSGGKPVFINFTKNLILDEAAVIFPRELLAVEVLETVTVDDNVVKACSDMKKRGYILALDDFTYSPEMKPLIDIVDIIKVDFRMSDQQEREEILRLAGCRGIKFLAEKIETHDEFEKAKEMGFSYFQGYFFSKPHIIAGSEIPGYKHRYLEILRQVNDPDMEFETLEHVVKRDLSITYKLLKFINSAAFGFQVRIQSIRQALTLLGLNEFRKWVSLVALSEMGDDKPEELLVNSMMRAKFCEFIATKIKKGEKSPDLFLLGMFSHIDAIIDKPMSSVIDELPLTGEVKEALIGKENEFRDILDIVIAYEKGEWDLVANLLTRYGIDQNDFPEIYGNAADWVNKIFF